MLLTQDFLEHELFEFIEWLGLSTECTDETVFGSYPSPLCGAPLPYGSSAMRYVSYTGGNCEICVIC